MRRLVLSLVVAPTISLAQAPSPQPERWHGWDWVTGSASALGGAVALGLGGYGLGRGIRWATGVDTNAFQALGGGLGTLLGPALGVWTYGALRGHEGSFGRAIGGTLLGMMAVGAVTYPVLHGNDDPPAWPAIAMAVVLPVATALGYGWSAQDAYDRPVQHALLPLTTQTSSGDAVLGVQWVGIVF